MNTRQTREEFASPRQIAYRIVERIVTWLLVLGMALVSQFCILFILLFYWGDKCFSCNCQLWCGVGPGPKKEKKENSPFSLTSKLKNSLIDSYREDLVGKHIIHLKGIPQMDLGICFSEVLSKKQLLSFVYSQVIYKSI